MTTAHSETQRMLEWLDHDADAVRSETSLGAAERERLESALAGDAGLRAEKRRIERLHAFLQEDAVEIEVDEGFTQRVMENLPRAAWQRDARAAWRLPLAAMLVFTLGAALLFAGAADGALVGTGLALADFLQATALAGAGLLGATWRGVGFGLEQLFQGSPAAIFTFAVLVIGVDLLFVALLRRRKTATESASADDGRDDA